MDIEPGGLEWEPADRRMTLGVDRGPTAVRWAVRDGQGRWSTIRPTRTLRGFRSGWQPLVWPSNPTDATAFGAVPGWRLARQAARSRRALAAGRGHPDDEPGYEVPYPRWCWLSGWNRPRRRQLYGGWAGPWRLCRASSGWRPAGRAAALRRALAPVNRMAKAATAMTAADLGQRLPVAGHRRRARRSGPSFNDLLDRLNDAFVRLNEAYDRQNRFAGDASHQLRTPIAALLGQVQVALRRDRSTEEYKRFLDRVQCEGDAPSSDHRITAPTRPAG